VAKANEDRKNGREGKIGDEAIISVVLGRQRRMPSLIFYFLFNTIPAFSYHTQSYAI